MSRIVRTFVLAGAAAALTAAGAALRAPLTGDAHVLPAAWADEIDDAVAALEAAAKDGDDGATLAKLVELQDKTDERVVDAVRKLLKSKNDRIVGAAVKDLARRKDESVDKAIPGKLDDKKLLKEHVQVLYAYLDAAAVYANPKHGKVLEELVKKHLPSDAEITTRAIAAYGAVREKSRIDTLIEWLDQVEKTGGSGQGGGGGGKSMSAETRENYAKAKTAIIAALNTSTGEDMADAQTWKEFWDKNRKTFSFPDPNAPEVDPTTLMKWNDRAYGYTIERPITDDWSFVKADNPDIRMRLQSADTEQVNCRVDFLIHNLSRGTVTTMDQLIEWYEKDYKENRFADIKEGPTVTERSIGGRAFKVITAKGDSGGMYKGWGTIEFRSYVTQVNHIVVRFEALVRLGAEPETKEALWKSLESVSWSK